MLIYRLPRGLGFVKGRSFCPKCQKQIRWYDNIPLLSFVLLRGRCRACHSPISLRYPLVELISGLVTVLIFKNFFTYAVDFLSLFSLICYLFLAWGLVVIFFIDAERQIIPDEITFPLTILFFVFRVFFSPSLFIFSAVGSFLFLLIIFMVTGGKGMGFGDVKLAFLIGLALGFPKVVVAFYLAFLTGAIFGIILILVKKRKSLKQKIAFGPFLAAATLISLLWGERIINFYQKILV